jgi:hypothetical protein
VCKQMPSRFLLTRQVLSPGEALFSSSTDLSHRGPRSTLLDDIRVCQTYQADGKFTSSWLYRQVSCMLVKKLAYIYQ